jgi:CHAT domain-containing protein
VRSEAAKDLMVSKFKNMQKGGRPEALREAKLNMKKSIRQKGNEKLSLFHPFFWSPFILRGDWR